MQQSSAWNFDIIEKQRNYGFIFIAAIFGVTGSTLLDTNSSLWVVVPPMVVILISRIITQLGFISIRLDRILDIEAEMTRLTGDDFILRTERNMASDFSSASVYAITYTRVSAPVFSVYE